MNGNKVFGHKSQQTSKKKTPFWTVLHGGSSEGSQQIFLYWKAPFLKSNPLPFYKTIL